MLIVVRVPEPLFMRAILMVAWSPCLAACVLFCIWCGSSRPPSGHAAPSGTSFVAGGGGGGGGGVALFVSVGFVSITRGHLSCTLLGCVRGSIWR